MASIYLDETHRLVGTDHAWELQERSIVKGKPRWRAYKYFTDIRLAVQEAARAEIRTSAGEGLAAALEAVERVARKYEQILDEAVAQLGDKRKLRVVS